MIDKTEIFLKMLQSTNANAYTSNVYGFLSSSRVLFSWVWSLLWTEKHMWLLNVTEMLLHYIIIAYCRRMSQCTESLPHVACLLPSLSHSNNAVSIETDLNLKLNVFLSLFPSKGKQEFFY